MSFPVFCRMVVIFSITRWAVQKDEVFTSVNWDEPDATRVVDADAAATYPSNRLLFVRQGTLLAQPFDLAD